MTTSPTTPALLAHRKTLAAALHALNCGDGCSGGEDDFANADALFKMGAVRDAASLPDDEALVDRVLDALVARQGMLGTPRVAAAYLDAFAAALAPTEEKA